MDCFVWYLLEMFWCDVLKEFFLAATKRQVSVFWYFNIYIHIYVLFLYIWAIIWLNKKILDTYKINIYFIAKWRHSQGEGSKLNKARNLEDKSWKRAYIMRKSVTWLTLVHAVAVGGFSIKLKNCCLLELSASHGMPNGLPQRGKHN